ncbi:uncharacterized protein TNCV_61911 [Trichonephila clavipes]|nr:uncharacterized protein TNCV_61911 [Trichonephila clavipes]
MPLEIHSDETRASKDPLDVCADSHTIKFLHLLLMSQSVKPLSVPSIIGIVLGVLILVIIGVSVYFWYRWREKKIRGYGDKSKALTADATDLEEIAGLESGKKPIPVTVL